MSYESYMRDVLGYTPGFAGNVYATNDYYNIQDTNFRNNSNLEAFYPDTYKKIYPLVCKECSTNTMPITEEILEQMIDNIYNSIEIDLKIETTASKQRLGKDEVKNVAKDMDNRNTKIQNSTLRDLIKILILNELLNNGNFPGGNRPPYPGRPNRPLIPNLHPPFPGENRPPFRN